MDAIGKGPDTFRVDGIAAKKRKRRKEGIMAGEGTPGEGRALRLFC
jgi:hypothetical protein